MSSEAAAPRADPAQQRQAKLNHLRALSRTQYVTSCAMEAGVAAVMFFPVYFVYHLVDGTLHAAMGSGPGASPAQRIAQK